MLSTQKFTLPIVILSILPAMCAFAGGRHLAVSRSQRRAPAFRVRIKTDRAKEFGTLDSRLQRDARSRVGSARVKGTKRRIATSARRELRNFAAALGRS